MLSGRKEKSTLYAEHCGNHSLLVLFSYDTSLKYVVKSRDNAFNLIQKKPEVYLRHWIPYVPSPFCIFW